MPKEPDLAKYLGMSKADILAGINDAIAQAAGIVVKVFQKALVDLAANSVSGTFEGYEVVVDYVPYRLRLKSIGQLKIFRAVIRVESPYGEELNVFDLLDSGRKKLPAGRLYPMWSLRDPLLVQRRNGVAFVPQQAQRSGGIRPEKQRFALKGQKEKGSAYRPLIFSYGPIKRVAPRRIYQQIYQTAQQELKNSDFPFMDIALDQVSARRRKVVRFTGGSADGGDE